MTNPREVSKKSAASASSREKALTKILCAGYEEARPGEVAEDAQLVGGVWYNPKWGCDSLDKCVDELRRLISSMGENK